MLKFLPFILLLFFVFSFTFRTDISFDQDLGRHIKLGEIIWQTKKVPSSNLFSYTYPNFPFINSHWLFEAFSYGVVHIFGTQTLLIIKLVVILAAVLITLLITKLYHPLMLPLGFLFLHMIRERVETRPEIFSFLFTSISYFLLEGFLKTGTKWVFALPFIQLLWVNTHIYFPIGLLLQAIFAFHIIFTNLNSFKDLAKFKTLLIVFVLSITATLINPNGLNGFLYPLNVNQNYGYTIVENQNIFFLEKIGFYDPNFLFLKICLAVLAVVLISSLFKNFSFINYSLALLGAGLALLHMRSFSYLFFLSFPALLSILSTIKMNKWLMITSTITAFLLVLESINYLNGDYYKYKDIDKNPSLKFMEKGKNALDFVLEHDLPQPIYNNFDIGSYIIYRGYPKYRVFVDGRPEGYPASFFQGVYIPSQTDYNNFRQLEELYKFQTVIFSITDQTFWGKSFLKSVIKDNSWNIVYLDDFLVILTKKSIVEEKKLKEVNLKEVKPELYSYENHVPYLRIASFLINSDNIAGAQLFINKALEIFPNSPTANFFLGRGQRGSIWW